MVGNDIVDIAKAREISNWTHPRFITKIFTNLEQEIIKASTDTFKCIWQLWSMKESAYKVYVQQFQNPFFNPKKIECKTIHNKANAVIIQGVTYYTFTQLTKEYIYTIAYTSVKMDAFSEVFGLFSNNPSNETRIKLRYKLACLANYDPEKISIRKCVNGVPSVFLGAEKLPYSITITHHGSFGGVALLTKN